MYNLDIELTVGNATETGTSINGETIKAHRTEVVYIYSYLTTEAPKYTFTDLDIQKLHLTGPKPWLNLSSGHNLYIAQWLEVYNEENGTRIPFYTTNEGTTTATQLSLTGVLTETGTWELYIPGYALGSTDTTTPTEVALKIKYGTSSDIPEQWVTVPIKTKQGSVYTHKELDASGRRVRFNRVISYDAFRYIQEGSTWRNQSSSGTGVDVVTPQANVRLLTYSTREIAYMEVEEQRQYVSGGPVLLETVYRTSLHSNEISKEGSYEYWSFNMPPLSGTDLVKGAYTVPSTDSDVIVTVHYVESSDFIRGSHLGLTGPADVDKKFYIANVLRTDGITESSTSYENPVSFRILKDTDETSGTGTYTANVARSTFTYSGPNSWYIPTISELGRIFYYLTREGSGASLNDNRVPGLFADEPYWSSSLGHTITQGGADGFLFKNNALEAHRSFISLSTVFTSDNSYGIETDRYQVSANSGSYGIATPGATGGTTTGSPPVAIDPEDSNTFAARVRQVQIVPWPALQP